MKEKQHKLKNKAYFGFPTEDLIDFMHYWEKQIHSRNP